MPALRELGLDLVHLSWYRRVTALVLPFAFVAAYFFFASAGWWPVAVAALVALSFVTYGSTSHDLVHRSLGLSNLVNDVLLCVIELLALRSGHAYRAAHLHHHACYPSEDDIEGAAARMTFLGSIVDGFTLQYRVWWWAVRRRGKDRAWMIIEGLACITLDAGAIASIGVTPVFAAYAGLMIAGSWIIPLITSYVPHDPDGVDELSQTRLFRGAFFSVVALEHLYHLEHHLYPSVPHPNWPELAHRLDPYLAAAGVKPVVVRFRF